MQPFSPTLASHANEIYQYYSRLSLQGESDMCIPRTRLCCMLRPEGDLCVPLTSVYTKEGELLFSACVHCVRRPNVRGIGSIFLDLRYSLAGMIKILTDASFSVEEICLKRSLAQMR
jgi:hypothetical protein